MPKICHTCNEIFSGDMESHRSHLHLLDGETEASCYAATIIFPSGYQQGGIYYYRTKQEVEEGPKIDQFSDKREEIKRKLALLRK